MTTFPDFSLGNIIPVMYPYDEAPLVPGRKTRPCLVLEPRQNRVSVSYGTRLNKLTNASLDDLQIPASEREEFKLDYPTRFCARRLCDFPISPRWIDPSKGCIIGTIPRTRLAEFARNLMGRLKRGQKVHHIPSNLARASLSFQQLAGGPTLELVPNCAILRSGDFSLEFWFDEEPSEVLGAIRTSPLLTQREKDVALDGLMKGRPAA